MDGRQPAIVRGTAMAVRLEGGSSPYALTLGIVHAIAGIPTSGGTEADHADQHVQLRKTRLSVKSARFSEEVQKS